jgi:hypothetical protein
MKNKVKAKMVCDSINHLQTRLTTVQVHCPKFLLQEIARHRVFSLSFNSARAIPAKTFRKSADYEPVEWLSNKPGMVGGAEIRGFKRWFAIGTWRNLSVIDKIGHQILEWCGLHKQFTNRRLEGIVWVDGVISSTDWENFKKLRVHPDAQPEFKELATQIKSLLENNSPDYLDPGEYHLPYIDSDDFLDGDSLYDLCFVSSGRCARVSYGFSAVKNSPADLNRAYKLLESKPQHLSPFEHVARCPVEIENSRSGNFRDWEQFRKIISDN